MGLLDGLFGSKKRILIADDDPNIRGLVTELLTGLDYDVVQAVDGLDAVSKFKNGKYALVILDVHMPRLEGPETLAALRTLPGGKEQRIIMLTSESTTGTINKAYELNVADYIFKPFNMDEFVKKVQSHLAAN